MIAASAFVLLLAGCGTANSEAQQQAAVNQQEKQVSDEADLLLTQPTGSLTEVDQDTSSENQSSPAIEDTEQMTENESGDRSSDQVKDEVFLDVLNDYNRIFDRIESEVNFNKFSKANQGYPFKSISTKEELYNVYADIMTEDAARHFFEGYVNESDEGLFLIPKDGHPKFNEDANYDVKKVNDQQYELTSEHQSDLHGKMTMNFMFVKSDGEWKIDEIVIETSQSHQTV